jgi:SM-20-related protein
MGAVRTIASLKQDVPMSSELQLIDLNVVGDAVVHKEPYTYFMGAGFLQKDAIPQLRRDFPDIKKPGFLTVSDVELRGSFRTLIEELEGPVLTEAISRKLGKDLQPYPRLTTIRKLSQLKDGRIHTDGESKLATFLVYMNEEWAENDGGRLRVLRGPDDFDDMAAEVAPVMGSVFGFLRSDKSWHGHKPFAGERRVVQVTWLQNIAELERKKQRNTVAKFFKGIFGR